MSSRNRNATRRPRSKRNRRWVSKIVGTSYGLLRFLVRHVKLAVRCEVPYNRDHTAAFYHTMRHIPPTAKKVMVIFKAARDEHRQSMHPYLPQTLHGVCAVGVTPIAQREQRARVQQDSSGVETPADGEARQDGRPPCAVSELAPVPDQQS
jgi:hypothetical protein